MILPLMDLWTPGKCFFKLAKRWNVGISIHHWIRSTISSHFNLRRLVYSISWCQKCHCMQVFDRIFHCNKRSVSWSSPQFGGQINFHSEYLVAWLSFHELGWIWGSISLENWAQIKHQIHCLISALFCIRLSITKIEPQKLCTQFAA